MFRWGFSPPATLDTDFNDADQNGWLITSRLPYAAFLAELEVGTKVRVADSEGNMCWGTIREIHGPIYIVEPDWSTWISAQHLQLDEMPQIRTDVNLTLPENHPAPA